MRYPGVRQTRLDFAQFYESDRDACLRAVLVSVGDRYLAEDLVAEAFARAWASWNTVSRHPAPRAWVVRTALNFNVSSWRRRRREVPLENYEAPTSDSPNTDIDSSLLAALQELSTRQREVVALRVFLDLDTETTAKVLDIAPGTVTAHLSRAVTALREHVRPIVSPSA